MYIRHLFSALALATAFACFSAPSVWSANITQQQSCTIVAGKLLSVLSQEPWLSASAGERGALRRFRDAQQGMVDAGTRDSADQLGMPVAQVQAMVDQQEKSLEATFNKRYSDNRLYADFAQMLVTCARVPGTQLGVSDDRYTALITQLQAWALAGQP